MLEYEAYLVVMRVPFYKDWILAVRIWKHKKSLEIDTEGRPPDLILMDVQMPGIGIFVLFSTIRDHKHYIKK